jgi:hypothetical protein
MINAPGNRISVVRVEDAPNGLSTLCQIEIATEHVSTRGYHWLLSEEIDEYNRRVAELKAKRCITLHVGGEYEGAFDITLRPHTSTGAYEVSLACRFLLDLPLHGDYGVCDSFIIEGEFVNQSVNRIGAQHQSALSP